MQANPIRRAVRACVLDCRTFIAVPLLLASSAALAQSTGSVALEGELSEVLVTSRRVVSLGPVTEQNAAKARVTVTQEFLATQPSGQTIFQSLNQVPGVNFTNSDAYGSSGGNLRIRGFDGSRVATTFDGMPLNDSGNYALFTNQILDPELVDRVDVNLGTSDVDTPTASATGGTVAFRSATPRDAFGGDIGLTGGENSFRRVFARLDSGRFGPFGSKAWLAVSDTQYDKFKGPGGLDKRQYNAKLVQEIGDDGDFVSVAAHWNRNRNAFYRSGSAATFRQFGFGYDNLATCTRDAPTAGTADNEGATPVAGTASLPAGDNVANPSSCSNFYGVRVNPSNTGNIRVQSLWHLRENLVLTVDPSYQYVLANGGGTNTLAETPSATSADKRVIGISGATGLDLNGDGDRLDTVRLYTPNTTNTNRYGLTSSLIWDVTPTDRVRLAYALDHAMHRQTGQWGQLDSQGFPVNVFAGREGPRILTADGAELRGRDRYSVARLDQLSVEYRGQFMDNRLVTQLGLRAPFFKRELNQYCYTPNGGSGNTGGALCTTQVPVATRASGNVVFVNSPTAVEYIAPYSETIKFDDVLPNVGATFRLTDTQTLFASYAENLSAPRTDNLYPVRRQPDDSIGRGIPESETTRAYDIGWRYNSPDFLASAALYKVDYSNRIVSSFDPDLGFNVDRNLGAVDVEGFDLQAGWKVAPFLTLSGTASYNDSTVRQNVPLSSSTTLATAGKRLVETPEWQYGVRADLTFGNLRAGLQGKYVGERAATDINDEFAPSYAVWDLDARYSFAEVGFLQRLELQLNVVNLFDRQYLGNISSGSGGSSVAFYSIGAPRTASLALRMSF